MILVIVTGAVIFGRFLAVTRLPFEAAQWVTGLTIPISSYDGRLIISFTGAASWVKDPQGLAECLDESFEAMKQALGPQRRAAPAGKRASRAAGKRSKRAQKS